jgi:hypothetical protein
LQEGFRGEVHPILNDQANLVLKAHWSSFSKRREKVLEKVPTMSQHMVEDLYRDAKPARVSQTYTARDFSAFLPEKIESPGQLWSIDPTRLTVFLRQFHPRASLHLEAQGRRAGPDGAIAILRGISPTHLDIVSRIHAEFDVTPRGGPRYPIPYSVPKGAKAPPEPLRVWFTPAYFLGRMIVNRQTGTVDYFSLALPADGSLNAHLTASLAPYGEHHDIVHVDQMELVGGDPELPKSLQGNGTMELSQARVQLARQFYKFKTIDWVPFERALALAHERQKPIMAMVLWGALDDQSC